MTNARTPDLASNPGLNLRTQFTGDVLSQEGRFMKAIFIAIAELAPRPTMTATVMELANCGRWVSESLNDNVELWVAEFSASGSRLQ